MISKLESLPVSYGIDNCILKWFTEFGHLNRGDMLTSEQYRCTNETKKF
ncbi:chromosome partitioning protein ParA [Pantoea sp. 3_1284]|nr:chromosome partitioning protein ParA [Pantoea sp. 3_1284]